MRKWIANRLVRLARRIHPENEEVVQFWSDRMIEYVITGQSNIKISHVDVRCDAALENTSKEK